jgi:hypothetical protein
MLIPVEEKGVSCLLQLWCRCDLLVLTVDEEPDQQEATLSPPDRTSASEIDKANNTHDWDHGNEAAKVHGPPTAPIHYEPGANCADEGKTGIT